jgi:hypothetical protein
LGATGNYRGTGQLVSAGRGGNHLQLEWKRSAGQCWEGWEPPGTREEQVSWSVLGATGNYRGTGQLVSAGRGGNHLQLEWNRSAGQCWEGWESPATRVEQVSGTVLGGMGTTGD